MSLDFLTMFCISARSKKSVTIAVFRQQFEMSYVTKHFKVLVFGSYGVRGERVGGRRKKGEEYVVCFVYTHQEPGNDAVCILIKWASWNLGRCLLWPRESEPSELRVSPRGRGPGPACAGGACSPPWACLRALQRGRQWRWCPEHSARTLPPAGCISPAVRAADFLHCTFLCRYVSTLIKGEWEGWVAETWLSHLSVPNIPSASRPKGECFSGSVKGTPFFLGELEWELPSI